MLMSLNCNLFSMNSAHCRHTHTHTSCAKPPKNKTIQNESTVQVAIQRSTFLFDWQWSMKFLFQAIFFCFQMMHQFIHFSLEFSNWMADSIIKNSTINSNHLHQIYVYEEENQHQTWIKQLTKPFENAGVLSSWPTACSLNVRQTIWRFRWNSFEKLFMLRLVDSIVFILTDRIVVWCTVCVYLRAY